MAEAILDALAPVLTRWTMGGGALLAAPPAWRDVLGDAPGEAELRLLALSGQFLGVLTLIAPTGELRPRPDIPTLPLPTLPNPLRPRARRVLAQLRDAAQRRQLLDFVGGRGWTLHPGDWMPGPNEDVPEVYAAWQDWAASDTAGPAIAVLDAESWDVTGPAERSAAFAALRRQDPARAAALLTEKIAGEAADGRVRLLEILADGLSDADRPLLETLSADRAPRVKALAASFLARLGHGTDGSEDAVELAAFFVVQLKGLLRRTRSIVPQHLKTPAQRQRRTALIETVALGGFARALGLAPAELIAAWPWGQDRIVDCAIAGMVARSGAAASVAAAAAALTAGSSVDPWSLAPLLLRLDPAQRSQAAVQILRATGATFAQALAIVGGAGAIAEAMRSPAGAALLSALRADGAKPADQADELLALGLIASRRAARRALDQFAAAGLIASDPRLDMLRLNAALQGGPDE